MLVLSVVGARPQFVKLAPMAAALAHAAVEHQIVHTGQHYDRDMSAVFFNDLHIPDADVQLGVGSGSHGAQTGAILAALDPVLTALKPDWLLAYGDTNSTVAAALAAVKLQIRVAHLEAGLRSYNRRMPEEHNRVLTDHAADLCLAPSEVAMANLQREGLEGRSHLTGDVMTDICFQVRDRVLERPVPVQGSSPGERFILATVHRAENTDDPERLRHLIEQLGALPLPVVLTAHPRLRARAAEAGIHLTEGSLRAVPPLSYPAMVSAVLQSCSVVTDSGGLQKEAYLLGRPCTTLRAETEWPETLCQNWNVLDHEARNLLTLALRPPPPAARPMPYGSGDAAARAVAAMVQASE